MQNILKWGHGDHVETILISHELFRLTRQQLTNTLHLKIYLILHIGFRGVSMPVQSEIGQRIRAQRQGNHMTLKQLAQVVGCSDAYLSQIENGKVFPSISSLKKIADALQSKITDFFVEPQDDDPVVIPPERRITISLERWNARIQSLVVNPRNKRMHPFFTVIQPGGGSHGLYSHVGEEFGIVLRGELEVDLDGTLYRVKKEESFYYNSSLPHSWTNPGKEETEVVWVISPPTF